MNRVKANVTNFGARIDLRFCIVDNAVDFMVALLAEKGKLSVREHLTPSSPHYSMLRQYAITLETNIDRIGMFEYYRVEEYDFSKQKLHLYLGIKASVPLRDTQAVRSVVASTTLSPDAKTAQMEEILRDGQFIPLSFIKPIITATTHQRVREYTMSLYLQYTNDRLLNNITHTRYHYLCTSLAALAMGLQIHDDLMQTFAMWTTRIAQHSKVLSAPLVWTIDVSNSVKAVEEEKELMPKPTTLTPRLPLTIVRKPGKVPAAAAPFIGSNILEITLKLTKPSSADVPQLFTTTIKDFAIESMIYECGTTSQLDAAILRELLNAHPDLMQQLTTFIDTKTTYDLNINIQLISTSTSKELKGDKQSVNAILARLNLVKGLAALSIDFTPIDGKPRKVNINRAKYLISDIHTILGIDDKKKLPVSALTPDDDNAVYRNNLDDIIKIVDSSRNIAKSIPTNFDNEQKTRLDKLKPQPRTPIPRLKKNNKFFGSKKDKKRSTPDSLPEKEDEQVAKKTRVVHEMVTDEMDFEYTSDSTPPLVVVVAPIIIQEKPIYYRDEDVMDLTMAPNISTTFNMSHVSSRAPSLLFNPSIITEPKLPNPMQYSAANLNRLRTLFEKVTAMPDEPIFSFINQNYLESVIKTAIEDITVVPTEKDLAEFLIQPHRLQDPEPRKKHGVERPDRGQLDFRTVSYLDSLQHSQRSSLGYNLLTYTLLADDLKHVSKDSARYASLWEIIKNFIDDKVKILTQNKSDERKKNGKLTIPPFNTVINIKKVLLTKDLHPIGNVDADTLLIEVLVTDDKNLDSVIHYIHDETNFMRIVSSLAPPWLYNYVKECYEIYQKMQTNLKILQTNVFNSITNKKQPNPNILTDYFNIFVTMMKDIGRDTSFMDAKVVPFEKAALLKLFSTFLHMSGPQSGMLFADDGEIINTSRVVSVRHLGVAFFMEIVREKMTFSEAKLSVRLAKQADDLEEEDAARDKLVETFRDNHVNELNTIEPNPEQTAIMDAMTEVYKQYLIDGSEKAKIKLEKQSTARVSAFSRTDAIASFYFYCYQSAKSDGSILARLVDVCDNVILKPAFYHYTTLETLDNPNTDIIDNKQYLFVWPQWPKEDYIIIHTIISTAAREYGARNEQLAYFPGVTVDYDNSTKLSLVKAVKWTSIELNLQTKLAILSHYLDRYFLINSNKNPKEFQDLVLPYKSPKDRTLHDYTEKSLKLLMIQFLPLKYTPLGEVPQPPIVYHGNPLLFSYFMNNVVTNENLISYCSMGVLDMMNEKVRILETTSANAKPDDGDSDDVDSDDGDSAAAPAKAPVAKTNKINIPVPLASTEQIITRSTKPFDFVRAMIFKAKHAWVKYSAVPKNNITEEKVKKSFAETICKLEKHKLFIGTPDPAAPRMNLLKDGIIPGNQNRPRGPDIDKLQNVDEINEILVYLYKLVGKILQFIHTILDTREDPESLYSKLFQPKGKKGRKATKENVTSSETLKTMNETLNQLKLRQNAKNVNKTADRLIKFNTIVTQHDFIQKGEISKLVNSIQITELINSYTGIIDKLKANNGKLYKDEDEEEGEDPMDVEGAPPVVAPTPKKKTNTVAADTTKLNILRLNVNIFSILKHKNEKNKNAYDWIIENILTVPVELDINPNTITSITKKITAHLNNINDKTNEIGLHSNQETATSMNSILNNKTANEMFFNVLITLISALRTSMIHFNDPIIMTPTKWGENDNPLDLDINRLSLVLFLNYGQPPETSAQNLQLLEKENSGFAALPLIDMWADPWTLGLLRSMTHHEVALNNYGLGLEFTVAASQQPALAPRTTAVMDDLPNGITVGELNGWQNDHIESSNYWISSRFSLLAQLKYFLHVENPSLSSKPFLLANVPDNINCMIPFKSDLVEPFQRQQSNETVTDTFIIVNTSTTLLNYWMLANASLRRSTFLSNRGSPDLITLEPHQRGQCVYSRQFYLPRIIHDAAFSRDIFAAFTSDQNFITSQVMVTYSAEGENNNETKTVEIGDFLSSFENGMADKLQVRAVSSAIVNPRTKFDEKKAKIQSNSSRTDIFAFIDYVILQHSSVEFMDPNLPNTLEYYTHHLIKPLLTFFSDETFTEPADAINKNDTYTAFVGMYRAYKENSEDVEKNTLIGESLSTNLQQNISTSPSLYFQNVLLPSVDETVRLTDSKQFQETNKKFNEDHPKNNSILNLRSTMFVIVKRIVSFLRKMQQIAIELEHIDNNNNALIPTTTILRKNNILNHVNDFKLYALVTMQSEVKQKNIDAPNIAAPDYQQQIINLPMTVADQMPLQEKFRHISTNTELLSVHQYTLAWIESAVIQFIYNLFFELGVHRTCGDAGVEIINWWNSTNENNIPAGININTIINNVLLQLLVDETTNALEITPFSFTAIFRHLLVRSSITEIIGPIFKAMKHQEVEGDDRIRLTVAANKFKRSETIPLIFVKIPSQQKKK